MNIRIIELSEQNLDQEGDDMPGDHSFLYIFPHSIYNIRSR
jgi:hypothetical protein